MRHIHLNENLSGLDYRRTDLTNGYFGECVLDGTQFGLLPNVTFYACIGSPDFSASPDLSTAYFRQNNFLGIMLPAGVTPVQHDLVAAVIRTKAASISTDLLYGQQAAEVANRIQSYYAQSWPDFYEWMRTRFGAERTRELADLTFAATRWRDRFDEVKR